MKLKRFFLFVGICVLFIQCATVPIVGRKQLLLLPESEMMAMSLTAYGDFLNGNKLSANISNTNRNVDDKYKDDNSC